MSKLYLITKTQLETTVLPPNSKIVSLPPNSNRIRARPVGDRRGRAAAGGGSLQLEEHQAG